MLCDGLAFGVDIEWPSGRYLHENFQVAWRVMSREGIWDEISRVDSFCLSTICKPEETTISSANC
jgi:hypothetical protein